MARILFEDDFTGTTGAAWSATKWATRAVGGGTGACTIQSNAGRMRSTGAWTGVVGKALVDKLDDFDMVCKFTNATTAARYNDWYYRCRVNVDSGDPGELYCVEVEPQNDLVTFNTIAADGATFTQLTSVATAGVSGTTTYWMRIRARGSRHQVKWWADGGSEPSTWQIDWIDNSFTSGAFFLAKYSYSDATPNDVTIDSLVITEVESRSSKPPVWRSSLSMN